MISFRGVLLGDLSLEHMLHCKVHMVYKLYCVGTVTLYSYEIERDHIYYDYTTKCLQSIHIIMSD